MINSHVLTSELREAEIKRDEYVKDANKLVTRATKYKDEAKRELKKVSLIFLPFLCYFEIKMEEKWAKGTEEEAVKTGPLEQV